jgi:hemerythrin-like domain-containing protein
MPASLTVFLPSANAIDLLTTDHDRIRQLFSDFERLHTSGSSQAAERVARRLCNELTVHATLEEEIFYPEARAELGDPDMVKQAKVEHAMDQQLIAQISAGSGRDAKFAAKVRVLRDGIERHMQEEEDQLFPRTQHTELDMQEIGGRLLARKYDLQAELGLLDGGRKLKRGGSGARQQTAGYKTEALRQAS